MALPHAKPGEIIDLRPLGPGLREARTAAIIKADHFEAVQLIVHAGAEIPRHKVSGEITLHCLEGHVELGVDPAPIMLKANEWVYLKGGAPHSVKGIEDSCLLLTIFLPHDSAESDWASSIWFVRICVRIMRDYDSREGRRCAYTCLQEEQYRPVRDCCHRGS